MKTVVKSFFTVINKEPSVKTKIDNFGFKCHYELARFALLLYVGLICALEYTKEHIKCYTAEVTKPKDSVLDHIADTYCYRTNLFTVDKWNNLTFSREFAHPGVGPFEKEDETTSHSYYQWVPYFLFLQAVCFYAPHYIWRSLENGFMANLIKGFDTQFLIRDNAKKDKKDRENVAKQLTDPMVGESLATTRLDEELKQVERTFVKTLGGYSKIIKSHRWWSINLIMCESLNLINLVLQVWLTDVFLNGEFLSLGTRLPEAPSHMTDPMDLIFPKVTKCDFRKYGATGDIQHQDIMCIMSVNVLHQKGFMIMWFSYVFLFAITVVSLMWRLASPFILRSHWMTSKYKDIKRKTEKNTGDIKTIRKDVEEVVSSLNFLDLIFFGFLKQNMDPIKFLELVKCMAETKRKEQIKDK